MMQLEGKLMNAIADVKGSEKFWAESGGEALLQLRGDQLSDTVPLDPFWIRRAQRATGTHCYRVAPGKAA